MEHIIERALPYLAGILAALLTWYQWVHSSTRQDAEYYRKKLRESEEEVERLKEKLLDQEKQIIKLKAKKQEEKKDG
jgi:5-bromo-4-chloroindolyl phosphate hydrolysis protein